MAGFDEIHLAPSIASPSGASSIVSIFISVHWVQQCLGSKIGGMVTISALISLRSSSMTVCYHISQKKKKNLASFFLVGSTRDANETQSRVFSVFCRGRTVSPRSLQQTCEAEFRRGLPALPKRWAWQESIMWAVHTHTQPLLFALALHTKILPKGDPNLLC